ncbi:MAG: hypothetical protein HQ567_32595, partial [Candidatus Nealsonbacteria bacterium]|nr:hypothetical protein [Candidatus Nealsonbacteria bacterium]
MVHNVEKWGKAGYGEKVWRLGVRDEVPALFVGMNGIDEEFRNRDEFADKGLYDNRLDQLVDALKNVMNDFGGRGKCFTNVYPIRYPGTWDTNAEQREKEDPEKWVRAGAAFIAADMVQQYMRAPELRWETAMRDDDGGLSLISAGIRAVTTAEDKQNQLQQRIQDVQSRLLQLSRDWVVDPDANVDREKRLRAARRVVDWLQAKEDAVYYRVHALQESLSVSEGDELQLSDCIDTQSRRHGDPLPRQLRTFLHEWATVGVPKRWEEFCDSHKEGGPWLDPADIGAFSRFLRDYLLTDEVFDQIVDQLEPVVHLKTRDEAARRRARRKYTRIILNDYVMNPGPSIAAIKPPAGQSGGSSTASTSEQKKEDGNDFERFGLMRSFVERWCDRVPWALALGAGEHVKLPPGNGQLIEILGPFEK